MAGFQVTLHGRIWVTAEVFNVPRKDNRSATIGLIRKSLSCSWVPILHGIREVLFLIPAYTPILWKTPAASRRRDFDYEQRLTGRR
jgi:hypothetical protein